MNWGNKLLIVFALFAGMMSYMVYRCFNVPVDLVSNEYYKDEIAYQQVIDGTKNANALSTKISIQESQSSISIQLPQEMRSKLIKGKILFYCPSNLENDKKIELSTDLNGKQDIDLKKITKGNYTVKIDWTDNNKLYHTEQPVTIL